MHRLLRVGRVRNEGGDDDGRFGVNTQVVAIVVLRILLLDGDATLIAIPREQLTHSLDGFMVRGDAYFQPAHYFASGGMPLLFMPPRLTSDESPTLTL